LEDVGLSIGTALEIQCVNGREDQTEASKDGSRHVVLRAAVRVPIPHSELINYNAEQLDQEILENYFEDKETVKNPHSEQMSE
jgi:hypothetical protein